MRGLISPFSAPWKPWRRPRQNRVVFVGTVVFLAMVLAIVACTSKSNHGDDSEGRSDGAATASGHGKGPSTSAPITGSSSKNASSDKISRTSHGTVPVGDGESPNAVIHRQCARGKTELKNRPMIIFKSARTGSTWLAWTGQQLDLVSGKKMLWTTEVGSCGRLYHNQLAKWFMKYFTQGRTAGEANMEGTDEYDEVKRHGRNLKLKCRIQSSRAEDYGPILATIDVKKNPSEIPEDEWVPNLSFQQWGEVFNAVPDLAIGVLVRTNAVKRAISSIAVEEQVRICGDKVGKKLTGKEKCIEKLPEQVHLNTTVLWDHVAKSDRKRRKLPELAARLSSRYSDGRIFCISYEGMEMNMPAVMEDLGNFIGAEIDPKSIARLREKQVSKKRGSDDLSEYIENYAEVRESLSSNKCILDQLESKQPKIFPTCLH